MSKSVLSIIAAFDENKGVGYKQTLPWNIPLDLKRFKALTNGHPIVMGRNTFDSIGRPLPNRTNIVLTKDKNWEKDIKEKYPKVHILNNWNEVLLWIEEHAPEKWFAIGGPSIWKLALPYADRLVLTYIKGQHEVDTYFPEWDEKKWEIDFKEVFDDFCFIDYMKKENKYIKKDKKDGKLKIKVKIDELMDTSSFKDDKTMWENIRFSNINHQKKKELEKIIIENTINNIDLSVSFFINKEFSDDIQLAQKNWFIERWFQYKNQVI